MKKITPCLWFDHGAEEAAKFYASIFENSKITRISNYTESGAQASGMKKDSVMFVEFELAGCPFQAINGGSYFKFNKAMSFAVNCKSEDEINTLWNKLSQGGETVWKLQKYPWSEKYGWCVDKYGVSWQLIINKEFKDKIRPAFLFGGNLIGKGEEAINYYTSKFDNSKVLDLQKDPETKNIYAVFTLENQEFVLMEGPTEDTLTQSISLSVNCKNQEEVDYFWKLSANGDGQCGWVTDKFGMPWQIVPAELEKLIYDADPVKSEHVLQAMYKMKKLDIAQLKAAYK